MARFYFKGLTLDGKTVKGVRDATTTHHLEQQLLGEKIALLTYSEQRLPAFLSINLFSRRIKEQDLIMFFKYLAALLSRGVPLVTALQLFSNQSAHTKLSVIVQGIHQQVIKGVSLAAALRENVDLFTPFIVQLIESGERTGRLDSVLVEAAAYLQDRYEFKKHLLKAALFPIITLCFAGLIFVTIFIFIIPQFEELFASLEKPIPASTQKVIWLSHLVQSWGFLIFLATLPVQIYLLRLAGRFAFVKRVYEKVLLFLPVVGVCYRMSGLIFFLKSLLLFVKSGFPVKQAFEQAQVVVHRPAMQKKLMDAASALNHGMSLTGALQNNLGSYIDDNTISLIAIGEQSGNLEAMLAQSISLLENNFKEKLNFLSATLQPILLVVIGLFIAAILVITYLPIFSLATSLH